MKDSLFYAQLIKNSEVTQERFGQDITMKANVKVEFEGNLVGLIEFMEKTFKNPNDLILKVGFDLAHTPPVDPLALALCRHLGVFSEHSPPYAAGRNDDDVKAVEAILPTLKECVEGGRKIQAIKALREATGCGLKEAKDAVEQELFKG